VNKYCKKIKKHKFILLTLIKEMYGKAYHAVVIAVIAFLAILVAVNYVHERKAHKKAGAAKMCNLQWANLASFFCLLTLGTVVAYKAYRA
jgi:hypothetical protein